MGSLFSKLYEELDNNPKQECEICLMLKKYFVYTQCKHSFCKTCFNDWVKKCDKENNLITCPCCRNIIDKNGRNVLIDPDVENFY